VRRRFRLAAVHRLRAVHLDQAARALAAARALERAEQARIETMLAEVLACAPPDRATAEQVRLAAAHREGLHERIASAREDLERLRRQSLDAIAAWESARADLHAVEVLRERFRRTELLEQARAEQRQTDELAAARYRARYRTQDREVGT